MANFPISPAIFDPNVKTEEDTKRGLGNIVAMCHLWTDFENGDLRPEEFPELFPQIRLAVFNSYNHSAEAPRFRVVIPFSGPISPEDYVALYDNIITKLVDAGYSVGNAKGNWRSGLDVSKKSPASLFYLPCQAKEASDSFFQDYNDDNRKILDPITWIKNTVVQLPQRDTKRTPLAGIKKVDPAAVEEATRAWREFQAVSWRSKCPVL